MATDPLSRVRAGLARDAEIARAAAEQSPRWTDGYEGEAWAGGYSDSLGEHTFGHVERHSPSRVLRQAENLREAEVIVRELIEVGDWWTARQGKALAELLASIYPEDTTETGGRE